MFKSISIQGNEQLATAMNVKKEREQVMKQRAINKHMATVNRLFKESMKQRNASMAAYLNPLNNTAAILSALSTAAGLHKDTVNFEKITLAMVKGYTLIDILSNPVELAGFAPSQVKWVKQFLAENPLPKVVVRPTRDVVIVPIADIHATEEVDGKVVSTLDYETADLSAENAGHQKMSGSQLADVFGGKPQMTRFVADRPVIYMDSLVYVNLHVPRPEDGTIDEETQKLIDRANKIMDEGIWVNGRKAVFLLQTASQARLLQAVFMFEDVMSIADAYRALGHDLLAYCKEKDGKLTLDVSKYGKRLGLAGTSTIASQVVSFPNARVKDLGNGEYMIVSDRHSIYVAEDRYSIIKEGRYKLFVDNEDGTKEIKEVDAADLNLMLTVADGALFCDEEIYWALRAEFGEDTDAWQIRLTPFGKGLMVFVPGLRQTYDANIVAAASAIKGDYRMLADEDGYIRKHDITLRIALFNKPMNRTKQYTTFPYQFTHITSLTYEEMKAIVDVHLANAKNAINDPAVMAKYAGVAHLDDLTGLTDEEQEAVMKKSIVSTFSAFMHAADFTLQDAYMKGQAVRLIREEVKKWEAGIIPVAGHYRFMIQDPLAWVAAKDKGVRVDGKLVIPSNMGLKKDTVFVVARDGKTIITDHVALFRNPAITKGEGRLVKGAAPVNYMAALTKGAFRNLCVMSAHDYNTFAMGGADNDGDTCLVCTESIIINNMKRRSFVPVLDLYMKPGMTQPESGCPYPMNPNNSEFGAVPAFTIEGVTQKEYKITFTREQYNDALIEAAHELSKDYVKRTLKPNRIGFVTNIATKLADAVRKIGYMILEGIDEYGNAVSRSKEEINALKETIAQYERYIDLLRLVQGWEIDRAKHGGAYEEALSNELDFIKNPPYYASYQPKEESAKRVWITPAWLRIHKGKEGGAYTNSVMSKLSAYVRNWVEKNLDAYQAEVLASVEDHNILDILNTNFAIDPARRDAIRSVLASVKFEYHNEVSLVIAKERELIKEAELKYAGVDNDALEAAIETVRKASTKAIGGIIEKYQAAVAALENAYDSKEIGYTAYWMTYTERTTFVDENGVERKSSITFPWSVCKKQFLDLVAAINNKELKVNPFIVEAADMKINFRVADGRNGEKLAAYLNNVKTAFVEYVKNPFTGNMTYAVLAEYNGTLNYVGDVYQSHIAYFTGATRFKMDLFAATVKKQSMFLEVARIERL
jgi:hypothetical protein